MLASLSIVYAMGHDVVSAVQKLNKFRGVSGRMEAVEKELCRVVVDYAHTPDALRNP